MLEIGTRVRVRVSPECKTHYEEYGAEIDTIQGRLAQVTTEEFLKSYRGWMPKDSQHDTPVHWLERPLPPEEALKWPGGWFCEEELEVVP